MSTRTLDSKKDRMIAILINPFVSCRQDYQFMHYLQVLFSQDKKIGIFDAGGIVVFCLYALGIIVAILMGKFFSEKVFKGEESYFIMELTSLSYTNS